MARKMLRRLSVYGLQYVYLESAAAPAGELWLTTGQGLRRSPPPLRRPKPAKSPRVVTLW
jgi:hypothetical protein